MTKKTGSRLGKVRSGVQDDPVRAIIYSAEGVGKSTMASYAPNPIFIDANDGTAHLPVTRYTWEDTPRGHIPKTFEQVLDAIYDLAVNDHQYETLVIDVVDDIEPLIWKKVIGKYSGKRNQGFNKSGQDIDHIEGFGFSKGYNAALDQWRLLAETLDRLRLRKGMAIVLLGHAFIKTYKNPEGDDYDRFQLRLHDKAAGFIKEWCDVVGFAAFEHVASDETAKDDRARGFSTGRRLLHLQNSAVYDAKARGLAVPPVLELAEDDPWAPLANALEQARALDAPALVKLIAAELDRIGDDELAKKVRGSIKKSKDDVPALNRYLGKLKTYKPKEKAQ